VRLILHDLQPMHWYIAGIGIAGITLALLLLASRRLSVSSGFDDICSLVLASPYFRRTALLSGRSWRLPLLVGLILGGFLSALLGGGWEPTWALGIFDRAIGLGPGGKLAWMFGGGLLIGFGTRLAGGCTAGHGIFGMANFERPSIISTITFVLAGIVTTQVVYGLIFPVAGAQ
jgi:uncharacterized membrane protein YedE/YeeE